MALILIIEDDVASQTLLVGLMRAAGHNAFGVMSGKEGLFLSLHEPPGLILCDIMLPDMDGYRILRQIRSEIGPRRVPVVAVTALAMEGDRERILAAGFDGYFSKPIMPKTFAREVEAFLKYGEPLRPLATAQANGSSRGDHTGSGRSSCEPGLPLLTPAPPWPPVAGSH